jgi:hypothetical protein
MSDDIGAGKPIAGLLPADVEGFDRKIDALAQSMKRAEKAPALFQLHHPDAPSPATRRPAHYTARMFPRHAVMAVPRDAAHILWQR